MFTMENALIIALSQACRYLRDPGLDPRVKQFLKRELGSELVSFGIAIMVSQVSVNHYTETIIEMSARAEINIINLHCPKPRNILKDFLVFRHYLLP